MPAPNPAALDFLTTRRSRPARTLVAPAPDRDALVPLLTAALRVPDHGKLEPWRLVVLERAALDRLATLASGRGAALDFDADRIEKGVSQFRDSPLCVAVIETPKGEDRIPAIEQTYSAGCVALSLVNAALAAGWGACWLTGWPAHDTDFLTQGLALAPGERLVGFVHIGTETSAPPERPRPDLARVVSWATD